VALGLLDFQQRFRPLAPVTEPVSFNPSGPQRSSHHRRRSRRNTRRIADCDCDKDFILRAAFGVQPLHSSDNVTRRKPFRASAGSTRSSVCAVRRSFLRDLADDRASNGVDFQDDVPLATEMDSLCRLIRKRRSLWPGLSARDKPLVRHGDVGSRYPPAMRMASMASSESCSGR
jgi:hypothetical protein